MYAISREYWFSAAHRLEGHPKCGRLHGHNYRLEVFLALDGGGLEGGWVMDFADMDAIIKPIVDALDHRYVVSQENKNQLDPYYYNGRAADMCDLSPYLQRSTAERLAFYFAARITQDLPEGVQVQIIKLNETPKSVAFWQRGPGDTNDD